MKKTMVAIVLSVLLLAGSAQAAYTDAISINLAYGASSTVSGPQTGGAGTNFGGWMNMTGGHSANWAASANNSGWTSGSFDSNLSATGMALGSFCTGSA